MTDIFISYASEDRARAGQFASAFEARGWSVWWDRRIVPVKLPLEFRRKQTADLTDWRGAVDHPGFAALSEGVADKIGELDRAATSKSEADRTPMPTGGVNWWALGYVAVLGVVWLALLVLVFWALERWENDVASRAAGIYVGQVTADSRSYLNSVVSVTVMAIGDRRVRVTADDLEAPPVEVAVQKVGSLVINDGGKTEFLLDLSEQPPQLKYSPLNKLTFVGRQQ